MVHPLAKTVGLCTMLVALRPPSQDTVRGKGMKDIRGFDSHHPHLAETMRVHAGSVCSRVTLGLRVVNMLECT